MFYNVIIYFMIPAKEDYSVPEICHRSISCGQEMVVLKEHGANVSFIDILLSSEPRQFCSLERGSHS